MIKWGVFGVGLVLIDVSCWSLPIPLYIAVHAGLLLVFISGSIEND